MYGHDNMYVLMISLECYILRLGKEVTSGG